MTAITTVPAHMRLARLTPYVKALVAAVAAVVASLVLGSNPAFASERSATHPARGQHQAVVAIPGAHETRRTREPRTGEQTAPVHPASPLTDRPAPAEVGRRQGYAAPQPRHASFAAAPRQVAAMPKEAEEAPEKILSAPAPLVHAAGLPRQAVQYPAKTLPATATAQVRAVAPPVTPAVKSEPVTRWTPTSHGVLFATAKNHDDDDVVAPQPPMQSDAGDQPQSAGADQSKTETQSEAAPQPISASACSPAVEEHRRPIGPDPQVRHSSPRGTVTGLVRRPARTFGRPGLALVARPAEALAPIVSMVPPIAALPASVSLLPAIPSLPYQPSSGRASGAVPAPAHQSIADGNPLAARIQSAVTVGALALLVPLLAIVLLFQVRLMHLMRSLNAEQDQPSTRYYSFTHEEVRELVPDMLPALAHHRFCESERHRGRWRPASWLELESTDLETPLMWSTCETCHHQRMTRLRSGQEVALSPQ